MAKVFDPTNPLRWSENGRECSAVVIDARIALLPELSEELLQTALAMPELQSSVRLAIVARLCPTAGRKIPRAASRPRAKRGIATK